MCVCVCVCVCIYININFISKYYLENKETLQKKKLAKDIKIFLKKKKKESSNIVVNLTTSLQNLTKAC